jgi:hypothetical protein
MELLPANQTQIKQNTETAPNRSNFYTVGFDQFEIFLESHASPDRHKVITVSDIRLTLEFPSIFKTMFQPMRRPDGKLKRIKCGMKCHNVRIRLHQFETNVLIYAYSHIFGGVDDGYRKWQALIQEGCTKLWEQSTISLQEKTQYIHQYLQYRSSLNKSSFKNELSALLELESGMSLSLIMSLRRRACDWNFNEFTPTNQGNKLPPLLSYHGDPDDPEHAQDVLMAAYIHSQKPSYDDLWAVLREIQFYSRMIESLQIELYSGETITSETLCASLVAERAKFSTALLLCKNPEPPNGAIGATDEICEPLFPWFQCDVGMSNFNISLHSGNDKLFPSVFLETQYGFHSQDIDKWQGNIDFSCESTGVMTLRIECRDTVFNGCMNSEIFHTVNILNEIVMKEFPLPKLYMEEYFPQDCFNIDSLFVLEKQSTSHQISTLDPPANHLLLRNTLLASILHVSNVVILFPDLETLPNVRTLDSKKNTPASFAVRVDCSFRILSGQNKEEFNVSVYRVELNQLPCMYLPLSSRVFGHYQWVDQLENKNFSLLSVENIEAKYQIRVDDCSLLERRYQDIQRTIKQAWGTLKSRLCVKIDLVSLVEYTNGRLISSLSSPTLDIRIKHLESDEKLAPTAHLHSTSKHTRFPTFQETAQFLVADNSSYSTETDVCSMNLSPYLLEILVIDDLTSERVLVAWCQIPSDPASWGHKSQHPLIESDTRIEIGFIRFSLLIPSFLPSSPLSETHLLSYLTLCQVAARVFNPIG